MGDIVNLRDARKRKARETAARQADENRRKHGVPKVETQTTAMLRTIETDRHAQHRRETKPGEPAGDGAAGPAAPTTEPPGEGGGSGI